MNIIEYINASDMQRERWIDTLDINIGLTYFGGKGGALGKDILRAIINHQANCFIREGKKREVFVDGFCGGGKMTLSLPEGWFDTIIMNDLDYGTYNFFKCCKEKPDELIEAVKALYSLFFKQAGKEDNRELYNILKMTRIADEDVDWNNKIDLYYLGSNRSKAKFKNGLSYESDLTSAAKTVLITDLSFMHTNDKSDATQYKLYHKDDEKESLYKSREKIINRIIQTNKILNQKNVIITRGSYDILLNYNIKEKNKLKKLKCTRNELDYVLDKSNVMYYFDSPYHPLTLSHNEEAPYDCPFSRESCIDMTVNLINHMKKDNISFIKSDYDPEDVSINKIKEVKKQMEKDPNNTLMINRWKEDWIKAGVKEKLLWKPEKDFECLNNKKYKGKYVKNYYLGSYSKSGSYTEEGKEHIWVYPVYF